MLSSVRLYQQSQCYICIFIHGYVDVKHVTFTCKQGSQKGGHGHVVEEPCIQVDRLQNNFQMFRLPGSLNRVCAAAQCTADGSSHLFRTTSVPPAGHEENYTLPVGRGCFLNSRATEAYQTT